MSVSIFRYKSQWIVLTDSFEITFHQTLANAMSYASAQIRPSNNFGTLEPCHTARYDC